MYVHTNKTWKEIKKHKKGHIYLFKFIFLFFFSSIDKGHWKKNHNTITISLKRFTFPSFYIYFSITKNQIWRGLIKTIWESIKIQKFSFSASNFLSLNKILSTLSRSLHFKLKFRRIRLLKKRFILWYILVYLQFYWFRSWKYASYPKKNEEFNSFRFLT